MASIVYLRPFDVDEFCLSGKGVSRRSLTDIASELCREREFNLHAIADPLGDRARGEVVIQSMWEEDVKRILRHATAAITVVGASPGTAWELRCLATGALPVLALRNPLLSSIDSDLLQAAVFSLFGGEFDDRIDALSSLAVCRAEPGAVETLQGDAHERNYAGVIAAFLTATRRLVNEGWLGSADPPLPKEQEPLANVLAIAAGMRRALADLDDKRDLKVRIGNEGSRTLVAFSLAFACALWKSPLELLRMLSDAYNQSIEGGDAQEHEIAEDFLSGTVSASVVEMRFVSDIAGISSNMAVIEEDGAELIEFSSQVRRITGVWRPRLEVAIARWAGVS